MVSLRAVTSSSFTLIVHVNSRSKIHGANEKKIINCKLCISVVFALTQFRLNFGEGDSMAIFAITYFLIDFYGVPLNSTVVSTSKATSLHEKAITCKVDNMQL